jgi:hypothetical protein
VVGPDRWPLLATLTWWRREAIQHARETLPEWTWRTMRRRGYRCVKVTVSEGWDDA